MSRVLPVVPDYGRAAPRPLEALSLIDKDHFDPWPSVKGESARNCPKSRPAEQGQPLFVAFPLALFISRAICFQQTWLQA